MFLLPPALARRDSDILYTLTIFRSVLYRQALRRPVDLKLQHSRQKIDEPSGLLEKLRIALFAVHAQGGMPTLVVKISEISPYRSPEDVLGWLLRLLSALWHRKLNAELAAIDLTEMQFVLLIGLGWMTPEGISVSQKDLGQFCRTSPALTSQVLRSLVRKKLVSVATGANDTRMRMVLPSKLGEKKLREAIAILQTTDGDFWKDEAETTARLKTDLLKVIKTKLAEDP
jgi:MarR family transcriptional regulator, organic hydroperoxide resistance regulator